MHSSLINIIHIRSFIHRHIVILSRRKKIRGQWERVNYYFGDFEAEVWSVGSSIGSMVVLATSFREAIV